MEKKCRGTADWWQERCGQFRASGMFKFEWIIDVDIRSLASTNILLIFQFHYAENPIMQ